MGIASLLVIIELLISSGVAVFTFAIIIHSMASVRTVLVNNVVLVAGVLELLICEIPSVVLVLAMGVWRILWLLVAAVVSYHWCFLLRWAFVGRRWAFIVRDLFRRLFL